ncbi:hypothetical protein NL676_030669 [Syzygium grande]|nr:hypothetical protein NL676_030669 [Syzygium grande]
MPLFLSSLQLKYGGAGASPYRTHPGTMGLSIACLLASCIAYLLKNVYLPDSSLPDVYGQALERATLLLASLSLASLVTLLLPSSWTAYSYVVYIFLPVGVGALMCRVLLKCKLSASTSETGQRVETCSFLARRPLTKKATSRSNPGNDAFNVVLVSAWSHGGCFFCVV